MNIEADYPKFNSNFQLWIERNIHFRINSSSNWNLYTSNKSILFCKPIYSGWIHGFNHSRLRMRFFLFALFTNFIEFSYERFPFKNCWLQNRAIFFLNCYSSMPNCIGIDAQFPNRFKQTRKVKYCFSRIKLKIV